MNSRQLSSSAIGADRDSYAAAISLPLVRARYPASSLSQSRPHRQIVERLLREDRRAVETQQESQCGRVALALDEAVVHACKNGFAQVYVPPGQAGCSDSSWPPPPRSGARRRAIPVRASRPGRARSTRSVTLRIARACFIGPLRPRRAQHPGHRASPHHQW